MKIVWLKRSEKSLNNHIDHIARDNHQAALRMTETIEKAVQNLIEFPHSGRPGRIAHTRELVVAPYVLPYRIKKDRIEILHILHAAQDWPQGF